MKKYILFLLFSGALYGMEKPAKVPTLRQRAQEKVTRAKEKFSQGWQNLQTGATRIWGTAQVKAKQAKESVRASYQKRFGKKPTILEEQLEAESPFTITSSRPIESKIEKTRIQKLTKSLNLNRWTDKQLRDALAKKPGEEAEIAMRQELQRRIIAK